MKLIFLTLFLFSSSLSQNIDGQDAQDFSAPKDSIDSNDHANSVEHDCNIGSSQSSEEAEPCAIGTDNCKLLCNFGGCYTGSCQVLFNQDTCQCQDAFGSLCVPLLVSPNCAPPGTQPTQSQSYRDTCDVNDLQCRQERLAYAQMIIDAVNNDPNREFTAVCYQWIALMSGAERNGLFGAMPSDFVAPVDNPDPDAQRRKRQAPVTFDSTAQWAKCADVIKHIRNQKQCGSCYAEASCGVLDDRICIQEVKKGGNPSKVQTSAQDLITCCDRPNCQKCVKGSPIAAYDWIKQHGIVTGGDLGSSQGCKPYVLVTGNEPTTCNMQCRLYYPDQYSNDDNFIKFPILGYDGTQDGDPNVETKMMNEIVARGSIVVIFHTGPDFDAWGNGIYNPSTQAAAADPNWQHSIHAVRCYGWDSASFLCANSWGTKWGNSGRFRLKKGKTPSVISWIAWPKVSPGTPACWTPLRNSVAMIQDATNNNKFLMQRNTGSCPCSGTLIRRYAFTPQTSPTPNPARYVVTIKCLTGNLCICDIFQNCYQSILPGFTGGLVSFCDGAYDVSHGECYNYLHFVVGQLQQVGNPTVLVNPCLTDVSRGSCHLKVRSISCDGCSGIISTTCTGIFA